MVSKLLLLLLPFFFYRAVSETVSENMADTNRPQMTI
jgi:hypothetical protein